MVYTRILGQSQEWSLKIETLKILASPTNQLTVRLSRSPCFIDVSPLTVTFVIGFLAETPIRNMPVLMSLCEIKSKVKLGVKNQENPFFGNT